MKQTIIFSTLLLFGIILGALVSPLLANQDIVRAPAQTCFVGESSNAACSGKWIYFAGNTSGVDSGAWVVRMNGETGEIWYKNGKRLQLLQEPK